MPWKKLPGMPGRVTVMAGAPPATPAGPPSREPSSWARWPSGSPSAGGRVEEVEELLLLLLLEEEEVVEVVWPDRLAEGGGGGGGGGAGVEAKEGSDKEVEKE